ncbi:VacJ family lipoprotein [Celerinatantimonas sp. MCCC 1A17872]|uniref:MlaA family lipoprotein n=1 Tax=Celerinatantimonas sp. MCCC 1A17872 TaxID=3177514 RepID=UPI0038C64B9A
MTRNVLIRMSFILAAMMMLAGCSSTSSNQGKDSPSTAQTTEQASSQASNSYQNHDPLEPFNRVMWNFDYNYLDKPIYRPVVHGYVNHVPSAGRRSLNNFMQNLEEPASMVNNLLQLKFKAALDNFTRFVFNSTFGFFGVVDVMGRAGVERHLTDFSDVLGHYGVGDGPYLMLPVLGPSTPRQITGDIVDQFYFPFTQLNMVEKAVRWTVNGLNRRASVIDQEGVVDNALDPYSFVRNAYMQYRRYRYYGGKPPEQKSQQVDVSKYMDEIEGDN